MFTGARRDPFFADAEGALHGFQWTGQDTFAARTCSPSRWKYPATCSARTQPWSKILEDNGYFPD
ncbi:MAG: hypothetical protein ACLPN6_05520 [Streptosporangiaceae bacterium]